MVLKSCVKMIRKYSIYLLFVHVTILNAYQENSKFLGNPEERRLGNRRRPSSQGSNPCSFGGGHQRPKNEGTGKTFFDFQYFNVEHNYNLEINCGGNGHYPQPAPVNEIHHGDAQGGHKPPFAGLGPQHGGGYKPTKPFHGHKPHRPPRPGGGGFFQNLFGGGHSENGDSPAGNKPGPFAGFFPSPQEFSSGLSEGIQGFIGTLPDIGQSFQSILPSFNDFQWPQLPNFQLPNFQLPNFQRPQTPQSNPGGGAGPALFGPVFPQGGQIPSNPFNGPPSFSTTATTFPPIVSITPAFVTPSPPTTTTDPDIIYSDEIKPVDEEHDEITDPYSNKPYDNLPPGQYLVVSNPHLGSYTQDLSIFNPTNIHKTWVQGVQEVLEELGGTNGRYRPNSYYSRGRSNQYQSDRQPSDPYKSRYENSYENTKPSPFPRGRPEGRSFSFPS